MATFDAITLTGDVDSGANATITVAHTAAAGSVMLVWAMHDNGAFTTSSMTWNTTESLTSVQATVDDSGGGNQRWALFMLVPVTTGAHNVVVTYSGTNGGNSREVIVMTWTGVATGSGVAGTHRTVAHGATPLSVTSVSGDTVVCATASLSTTGMTSGQTARGTTFNAPGGTNNWIAAGSTVAVGASTAMSFSGGIGFDTLIGLALIDAVAGAAQVPYQPNYQRSPILAQ